jgi:glycosyltransferase involved in cell wall biosynthesis
VILISNGVHRCHLSALANELASLGVLAGFVTCGYPSERIVRIATTLGLAQSDRIARLLDRGEDLLDNKRIFSIWSVEIGFQLTASITRVLGDSRFSTFLNSFLLNLHGFLACIPVLLSTAKIYHYRAGFGGLSVRLAKIKGMRCICDHTAVSPLVFQFLIANSGSMPRQRSDIVNNISRFWRVVDRDITISDRVLVNSHFVEMTMRFAMSSDHICDVVYLGVDDKFLHSIPEARARPRRSICFAGRVSKSKGFDTLAQALMLLEDDWSLHVAGGIDNDIRSELAEFLQDPRVQVHGVLSRAELAELLAQSEIFVFPSLAEGSARVVFEAMACGCYIITTPNAGSIVADDQHGALVQPGDSARLATAIRYALKNPEKVCAVGANNMQLVRDNFRQSHYGRRLLGVYESTLAKE